MLYMSSSFWTERPSDAATKQVRQKRMPGARWKAWCQCVSPKDVSASLSLALMELQREFHDWSLIILWELLPCTWLMYSELFYMLTRSSLSGINIAPHPPNIEEVCCREIHFQVELNKKKIKEYVCSLNAVQRMVSSEEISFMKGQHDSTRVNHNQRWHL